MSRPRPGSEPVPLLVDSTGAEGVALVLEVWREGEGGRVDPAAE